MPEIIETQIYYSDIEKKIKKDKRKLTLTYLGVKEGLQFYKTSSSGTKYIEGEMIINYNSLSIVYSKKINIPSLGEVIFHSMLNKIPVNKNIWEGYSSKSNDTQNNNITLEFV